MKKAIIQSAAALTVLFAACNSAKDPFYGYEKAESGLYSKFELKNEGARKPKMGDYALMTISYTNDNDSLLFNSHNLKNAENGIIYQPVMPSTFKGSFEDAILMMAEGDSAKFKILADSVYLKTFKAQQLPPFIKSGSYLTFNVKLHKVRTQQELVNEMQQKEVTGRNDYLAKNNITDKPLASGMYIINRAGGSGSIIKEGQTAFVLYTGKLVNGTVFDASAMHDNKPIDVKVGDHKVIPAWEEALATMKKGEKATLIIPSEIGYGAQGGGPIPPYSTLLFDIEVVDVK